MAEVENVVTVSCVIPTHDRDQLLRESLASVANQECPFAFDVIVVDDLESRQTREIVIDFSQEYPTIPFRYLPRAGYGGASASRNFGAATSSSEYLAFLDDDDLWEPSFLADLIGRLKQEGAGLAISGLDVLDEHGARSHLLMMPRGLSARDVAARNLGFTGSNFVVERSRFEALQGFDSDLLVSNDKDFLVRYLLRWPPYVVSEMFLAVHRRHSGPQLTRPDLRRAQGMRRYLAKHRATLTCSGRRFIRKSIYAIERRLPASLHKRIAANIGYVGNFSPRDIISKWRRRDGRFSEFR
jgi:glycosyltransferase involved in cell wall biosynthesis